MGNRKENFQKIMDGIRHVVLTKDKKQSSFPNIILSMVILKQNWTEIVNMITFSKRIGAQAVNFIPSALSKHMKALQIDKGELPRVREELVEALRIAEKARIDTNIRDLLNEFSYFTGGFTKSKSVQSQTPRYVGWIFSYILEDGVVVPCCENYVSPLGDLSLKEYSFEEIWHLERYQAFRKMGINIPKERRPVRGCDCFNCNFTKNNRTIHRMFRFIGR
jgi:hypothetical protein